MARVLAIVLVSVMASSVPARAADFYQGKQITIVVGFTTGPSIASSWGLRHRHYYRTRRTASRQSSNYNR